jgi:galactosamine-6-phosphate isomerase
MLITKCDTLAELNELASALVIREIQQKPKSLICAATGSSPTGVYKKLVENKKSIPLNQLTFIKLDEWYGLEMGDPASCEYYLQKNLLQPLGISSKNYIAFDSKTQKPEHECSRIDNYLGLYGPIDLCILGIGKNGHVAFNEPADVLEPHAHLSPLSKTSLAHTMVQNTETKIGYGLTLGMADILKSKKIILLANGTHKREVMERLFEQKISTQLPASFLWLHADAHCFYCDNDQ